MKPQLFASLKGYKKHDLVKDLFAGLMVAIIALPLSIALGIQSVPGSARAVQFGIITAIVAGFFISFLGGSKYQIGGPTAAFVVILASYVSNPNIGLLGLAIAGIMAGVILILLGLLRAGSVMKFFPYPITIGFTTGIGITLIIGQINDLCGFGVTEPEALHKFIGYFHNIKNFDFATFGVGAIGLLCVILLPKINKKIPSAFVALIVCTGATFLFNGAFGASVATIGSKFGKIEAGFFPINFSSIGDVKFTALIVPSIVIAFLCAIESLLSATVASGMTNTTFNPNQELMGQGVANIASSLLGGLPATGAIARTAAGIENGARSPLTGVFHALFLLVFYFLLMSVVQYIPLAVFSAILISVAINMSRFKLFARLTTFGIRDSIILIVTCVLTIVFDLTYGVLGGVAVTFILNAGNFKKGLKTEVVEGKKRNVVKAKGTIFFVNANKLVDVIEKAFTDKQLVTLDLSKIASIDESAFEKISTLRKKLSVQGKTLDFVGANKKVKARISKFEKVI
ncbi:MAG: SulP family inorganic anion transporter [Clostridia bacterium]|nr:SulP family inorganic anion transporter [Clostridia bacterium]